MPVKILISYDDTDNDRDAIALARLLAYPGAELAIAYVRHMQEPLPDRETQERRRAEEVLEQGAQLLGNPDTPRFIVFHPSTGEGLLELAEREHADVIVFGSDYRTAPGTVLPQASAQRLLHGGSVAVAIAPAKLRDQLRTFRTLRVDLIWNEIRSSLADFGVIFDVYFSERTLHESGALEKAIARLREHGHVYEADGAVWLRTTDFADDKDRVLVKSDGEPTYFAADCAYYLDKRERGFDKVLIMLGADHTGYVGRYKALVAAMGDDPDTNLEILIGQLVNLVRDGQPLRMRTTSLPPRSPSRRWPTSSPAAA